MNVRQALLTRARNLERYPFESATMAEAGRLAAKHLREAASDLHKKSLESVHDDETCPANATHEVFYIMLADDGTAIRKWCRSPFDGARLCRVELPAQGMQRDSPETQSGSGPSGLASPVATPCAQKRSA